jgi:hypothetical protein
VLTLLFGATPLFAQAGQQRPARPAQPATRPAKLRQPPLERDCSSGGFVLGRITTLTPQPVNLQVVSNR